MQSFAGNGIVAGYVQEIRICAVIVYICQSITVVKRIAANGSDAAADGHGSQSITVVKRIAADGGDAVLYNDGCDT